MSATERPLVFNVGEQCLYGILHAPPRPAERGVVVVVGGPQYRVGSHRQFLMLARHLAANGIACLRFDYRGMGDSDGPIRSFEVVADDIRAAVDAFVAEMPAVREVVLWGLCDAASASAFYAETDPRVGGLVLLNPWVRTEEGIAKAYLKLYYLQRLFDRNLWRKVLRGEFNWRESVVSLFNMLRSATGEAASAKDNEPVTASGPADPAPTSADLPQRVLSGLQAYSGRLLVILSGDDLTAEEFRGVVSASRPWRKLLGASRVTRHELAEANHTFSRREWRDQVADWTLDWLRK